MPQPGAGGESSYAVTLGFLVNAVPTHPPAPCTERRVVEGCVRWTVCPD